MPLAVEFEFKPNDRVKTPFGDEGIVEFCAVDSSEKQYSIKTRNGVTWFKESELKLWEEIR